MAHTIFGVPATLNCANFVYFEALQTVSKLQKGVALQVVIDEILALHIGQGLDIAWRDGQECPTESQYVDMVVGKTGGLLRLAARLMQCFSEDSRNYIPLLNELGLYYQVMDDLFNVRTDYRGNKSFAEGKRRSFYLLSLLIFAILLRPH